MRAGIFFLFFTLIITSAFAQLKLSMGNHFLAGQDVKKIEVSPEDYTIWALTSDNKVYYKTTNGSDFQLFTPVGGLAVTDLAGYTINEMYFLVGTTIVRVKSGVITNIPVPVTKVNGITIVSSAYNTSQHIYSLKDGWLMIATDNNCFLLPKGTTTLQQYTGNVLQPAPHYNWDYIHSDFKGVYMRNNIAMNICTNTPDYSFYNIFYYTLCMEGDVKFPSSQGQFNASIMPFYSYDLFAGAGYGSNYHWYNVWATSTGLYAYLSIGCGQGKPINPITQPVNIVTEAMALTQVNPQHFLLAGTNNGIQYTPTTIFPSSQLESVDVNKIKFTSFTDFPNVKVNDILIDSRKNAEQSAFVFVCDKSSYVATTDGVYQLGLSYDPSAYSSLRAPDFAVYGPTPTYDANNNAIFNRCDNTQPVTATLLDYTTTSVVIRWYKDGVEVPAWANKQGVILTDNGTYHAEVTSLCEGVTINSRNFVLQSAPDPQITFNYPDNVSICEGTTYPMTTQAVQGYSYRWFKDNQQLSGINTNSYTATQPGQYRVEVSSCGTSYKPSKTVTITNTVITPPVISPDKASYCIGETATLSVANTNQYNVKWYLNGNELTANANQNAMSTIVAGVYTAKFLSNGCEKLSAAYNLSFNEPINFTITRSKPGALCDGDKVTLSASTTATSYLWSTGETTSSITVSNAGTYTLQLSSPGKCASIQSVQVTVLPKVPLAGIDDKTICTIAGEKLRIKAQEGFVTYTWNGQSTTNNYFDVTTAGTYKLIATNADGCSAETTFEVTPWCEEVVVTNTFTPNGDGINDYWQIGGVENDATATIQIFNRLGTVLVNKKANGFRWDGKYNGKDLPAGTYYYEIKTKNSAAPLTGWVAIIR